MPIGILPHYFVEIVLALTIFQVICSIINSISLRAQRLDQKYMVSFKNGKYNERSIIYCK